MYKKFERENLFFFYRTKGTDINLCIDTRDCLCGLVNSTSTGLSPYAKYSSISHVKSLIFKDFGCLRVSPLANEA